MNRAINLVELPALTANLLHSSGILVDNLFANLWREISMKLLLNRASFQKRSGVSISDVVYHLLLWLWLKLLR